MLFSLPQNFWELNKNSTLSSEDVKNAKEELLAFEESLQKNSSDARIFALGKLLGTIEQNEKLNQEEEQEDSYDLAFSKFIRAQKRLNAFSHHSSSILTSISNATELTIEQLLELTQLSSESLKYILSIFYDEGIILKEESLFFLSDDGMRIVEILV